MACSTGLDACGVARLRIIGELPATGTGELRRTSLDHEGHARHGSLATTIALCHLRVGQKRNAKFADHVSHLRIDKVPINAEPSMWIFTFPTIRHELTRQLHKIVLDFSLRLSERIQ
jgi:hypothetical protein